MNVIYASRRPPDRALLGTGAGRADPTASAPVIVCDEGTGEPAVALTRYPGDLAELRRALLRWPNTTTLRAAGSRNAGGVFGHVAANAVLRRNGARVASAAIAQPEAHATVCRTAALLAEQLREIVPERAQRDTELTRGLIRQEWMVAQEAWWTSGVVNWLSPLPYHFDRNNLETWSAMPVVRRGVEGGVPPHPRVRPGAGVPRWGRRLLRRVEPDARRDAHAQA